MEQIDNTWQAKVNHLRRLVKSVSDHHGGDETVWLNNYIDDLINRFKDRLDDAILCFEDVHPVYIAEKYLRGDVK